MSRDITISMAFGSHPSPEHNRREAKATAKQKHIAKGGYVKLWKDEDPDEAYNLVFGDALREYNSTQKRAGRKIKNYRLKIKNEEEDFRKKSALERSRDVYENSDDASHEEGGYDDKKGKSSHLSHHAKHELYEVILQIGNKRSYEDKEFTREESEKILKEAVEDFERSNPNIHIVQEAFHADEQGAPHVHVVWVPFADGFKKGPKRQNSLTGALRAEGYETDTKEHRDGEKWETAQRKWEASCVDCFASTVSNHGFKIISQNVGHSHMSTEEFKAFAEWMKNEGFDKPTIDNLKADYNKLVEENKDLTSQLATANGKIAGAKDAGKKEAKAEYDKALNEKQTAWDSEKATLTEKIAELESENARDDDFSEDDDLSEKAEHWDNFTSSLPNAVRNIVCGHYDDRGKYIEGDDIEIGEFFKRFGNEKLLVDFHRSYIEKKRREGKQNPSKGDDWYK